MAIYTGVADANGDFNIPFSANYTSGQKITVTAEKDAATKSIEIFAPSEATGGGVIQFSGDLTEFPKNIGVISIGPIYGTIGNYAFSSATNPSSLMKKATGLIIKEGPTVLGNYSFENWVATQSLEVKEGVQTIGTHVFSNWQALKSAKFPSTLISIGDRACQYWYACDEIELLSSTPPTITTTTFSSLKATCIFKVPAGSVAAYQAAANWSAFAARIEAI